MIIYLVIFFISILSTYFAEKSKKKVSFVMFSLIAILAPAILAGVRSENVGTDIHYYAKYYFEKALETPNILEYLKSDIEIGYLLLTYVVTYLTKSFHFLLFIIQLIINSCVYYFIYNNREKSPMYISMTIFLLFFYNISLNIMRQSIAVAIFLCSLVFVKKKKYIKTAICFIIAFLFHSSAVMAIPIYCFILIENLHISKKSKLSIFILIILVLICLSCVFQSVVSFLANDLKIIPVKYYNYLNDSYFNGANYDFNLFILIYKAFWIVAAICASFRCKKSSEINEVYYILLIIDLIIFVLSARIINIERCGYYYVIPGMLMCIPQIRNLFKKDAFNQAGAYLIITGLLLSYWYVAYIHFNMNCTYPYSTFFK